MARIYKQSDRIEIKIEDVTIKVKPLSYGDKSEIQTLLMEGQTNKDYKKLQDATYLSVRYCLKSISGIEDSDGNEYKLNFDDDGKLSEECLEDLTNMDLSDSLMSACAQFINGIPKEIEGAEIISDTKKKSKKNK